MNPDELKQLRAERHWNQTQAARYLGTTQANISRWEKCEKPLPPMAAILVSLLRHPRNVAVVEKLLYK